jgi:hypothetical protein
MEVHENVMARFLTTYEIVGLIALLIVTFVGLDKLREAQRHECAVQLFVA